MKLPSISDLSVQSSICSGYYWNNVTIPHSVLSSPRSSREHYNSISFVAFGVYPSKCQQQLRKGKLMYPILFAQLQKSDSFESNSGKSHEDVADADIEKYGSKFSIQKSHINEEESSKDLSFSNKNLSEYPLNYGVWLNKLQAVHLHVLAAEQWNSSHLNKCNRAYLESATNLIHYLSVKSLDVNQLKEDLYSAGLVNLDSSNLHVLASITSGIKLLENLQPNLSDKSQKGYSLVMADHDKAQGGEILADFSIRAMKKRTFINKAALFGPAQDEKEVNIMVTVGREAIENETLLADIIKAGANVIRINCAHDDPTTWSEIIRLARHSSQMLEKPCRILMDLAGPKLRTGIMNSSPSVTKLSPRKDATGDVMFPAQVWLSHAHPGSGPPTLPTVDAKLFVEDEHFLKEIEIGNVLKFIDFRGRKRSLKVSRKLSTFGGYGFIVESSRTAYVASGTKLFLDRKNRKSSSRVVVNVPTIDQFIRVRVGDSLTIIREPSLPEPGNNAYGAATITCNSSRLFDSVKPGDPIAFDDGKIWGVVRGTSTNEIVVAITHASPKGSKLGSEKSINIPKSQIHFEGLTSKDLMDLEFVAANADIVGISFIRNVHDMEIVLQELKNRKLKELGIILKIETCSAFDRLPLLLLQAMQFPNPLGVMIARGDLAVECGWDQMASIQEEILSICNAAHVPVTWATQVLESLAKRGIPTRAEVTDVACGMRASCIMLNKGKYIVEAVSTLKTMLANRSTEKSMKNLLKPLLPTS